MNKNADYEILVTGDILGKRFGKPLYQNQSGRFINYGGITTSAILLVYGKFIGEIKIGEKVWLIDNKGKPAVENLIKLKKKSIWLSFFKHAKDDIAKLNNHKQTIEELRYDIYDSGSKVQTCNSYNITENLVDLIITSLRLSFKLGINTILEALKLRLNE